MKDYIFSFLKYISLFSIGCLVSCSNEDPVRILNEEPVEEVEEILFSPSELTEDDIVNLIKLNFLEEYGGVELERIVINDIAFEDRAMCAVDSFLQLSIIDEQGRYQIYKDGGYFIICYDEMESEWVKSIIYRDSSSGSTGSVGRSELGNIVQLAELNYSISIIEYSGKYGLTSSSDRDVSFGSGRFENFEGKIEFFTASAEFDFENGDLSDSIEYEVWMQIWDKMDSDNDRSFYYKIRKLNNQWILDLDDGNLVLLD